MTAALQIRRTPDGRVQARRLDGKPLTLADREEACRLAGTAEAETSVPAVDSILAERVVAVLIDSTVLGSLIWFALSDDWRPDREDKTPVFYGHELPALREKTPEQLRSIFNLKRSFGGGMVRQ